MFQTIIALLALTLSLLTGAPAPAAPTPPPAAVESIATPATEGEQWAPVDNQWAALVQCNFYLEPGSDRDACTAAALQSFPPIAPCADEDSPGPCYWNAGTRGNGVGESFTVNAAGVVTFVDEVL